MLVHFPIALFIVAGMLDVFSWVTTQAISYQAARYIFNLAAFFSILSVGSGLWEAARIGLNHPILSAHRFYAIIVMLVSCIFCCITHFIPARFQRPAFSSVVLICVLLVIITGYFGGKLVFDYGVGVEH